MGELSRRTPHSMSPDDYMRLAIAMAQNVPQFPFGAVIVRRTTGEILAQGFNRSSHNPTFHGEIDVINRCAADHSPIDWTALDFIQRLNPVPCVRVLSNGPEFLPCTLGLRSLFSSAMGGGKSISGPRR